MIQNDSHNHNANTKVSVVMTAYNGEKFIETQINSILINLDQQDELLIGDDGSKDATLDIIHRYELNDSRIRFFQFNHLGTSKNLETLLSKCTGDIIFISDQDDCWESTKVKDVCNDFENHPNVDLVFHNSRVSAADINDIKHLSLFDYLPVSKQFWKNVVRFHFWGCMFAVRKNALGYILPLHFGFDSWMIFCTTFFNRCYIENKILMTYRRHGGNLSTFKQRGLFTVIKGHLGRLFIFFLFLPSLILKFLKCKGEV